MLLKNLRQIEDTTVYGGRKDGRMNGWCNFDSYGFSDETLTSHADFRHPRKRGLTRKDLDRRDCRNCPQSDDGTPIILVRFRFMLGHGFQAAAHMHLLADVLDVGPHGFRAYGQFVTDLLVDKTGGEQFQNLPFTR